jgi:hypothetical protein
VAFWSSPDCVANERRAKESTSEMTMESYPPDVRISPRLRFPNDDAHLLVCYVAIARNSRLLKQQPVLRSASSAYAYSRVAGSSQG